MSVLLPLEIWLRIFFIATHIPGAFETNDPEAFLAFSRDIHGINLQNRYSAVMDTKLALSLVCKDWRALSAEIMFEYVRITSGEQAICVAALFEKKECDKHQSFSRGRWTRRLELALDGVHIWTRKHSTALRRIVRTCIRLTTFSYVFCTADEYLFIDFLQDLSRHKSVQRLELRTSLSASKDLIASVADSLRSLWIFPSRRFRSPSDITKVHLPCLQTFILSPAGSASRGFNLAEHLETPALTTFFSDSPDQVAFIQRNGRRLLHVSIPQFVQIHIYLLLCCNIQRFTITFQNHRELETAIGRYDIYPTISCILLEGAGFFLPSASMSVQDPGASLRALTSLQIFPSLTNLRFLLPLTIHGQDPELTERAFQTVKAWIYQCQDRGIYLQVSRGADDQTAGIWQSLNVPLLRDLL